MMSITQFVVGIDISKNHLDVYDAREGETRRIANAPDEAEALVGALAGQDCLVVYEATGRYDRVLSRALAQAGVRHARVNPEQARHFARACGLKAKTDAIDARMLADLGRRMPLRVQVPLEPVRERLAALSSRRDQLVAVRKQERTRVDDHDDPLIRETLAQHLAWLDQSVAQLDRAIAKTIAEDADLARADSLLRSAPGIGPVTATVLIAQLPELGRLNPKAVAALAGLAPYNNDSGSFGGKRTIRGGRTRIRQALYMAAVTAARSQSHLGQFNQRLRDAGKPAKLALIATARKILTVLNAILRTQTPFRTMP